jgi:hypothetical protein
MGAGGVSDHLDVLDPRWCQPEAFIPNGDAPSAVAFGRGEPGKAPPPVASAFGVVPLDAFADAQEPTAEALLGTETETLLAAGGMVLEYGDGGTSKTTLTIDAVAHLAAGINWLGIPVGRPLRILLIENEGPRGKFRQKLDRKRATWTGPAFAERVFVLEEPWGRFSFATEAHRAHLAAAVREHKIDLVVANPLAELGHQGGGTPDDVSAFMAHLEATRQLLDRPLAFWLLHHENKAGDVAGAWERAPDTLVHVRLEGREKTRLHWRKTRWSSALHGTAMTLQWAIDTEGFDLVDAGDATAAKRAADLEDATAWLVAYAAKHPRIARSKAEAAYQEAHGGKGRNLARAAIDEQLSRHKAWQQTGEEPPALATTSGERANGTYLIPFSQATSPLAIPLNGEDSENPSDPEPGTPLATSPTPIRGGEEGGEEADGVASAIDGDELERLAAAAVEAQENA